QQNEPGVRHVRAGGGGGGGLRTELRLARRAMTEALKGSVDLVYARISPSTSLAPRVARARAAPLVLELNGAILDELERAGRSKSAITIVKANLQSLIQRARALVTVEERIAQHARERLGCKNPIVIHNGADLHVATPGSREDARRRLDLPLEGTILGFAGTLSREVRLEALIELLVKRRDLSAVVAGDGPARNILIEAKDRLQSRLRWLGAVPHDVAIDVLRASDVAINLRVGWIGMKPLEYAAVGRRFVNPRALGWERIDGLYPGLSAVLWLDEVDGRNLEVAVDAAIDEERVRGPLPAAAVARARAHIGWEHTARKLDALFRAVTEEAKLRG
ncbi:MAG: glycosyltransferase family 4 protein, partial [Myxococcales bacterium]|nr:glycosyltransferase family 4 protein [Myxococcales bacterium]